MLRSIHCRISKIPPVWLNPPCSPSNILKPVRFNEPTIWWVKMFKSLLLQVTSPCCRLLAIPMFEQIASGGCIPSSQAALPNTGCSFVILPSFFVDVLRYFDQRRSTYQLLKLRFGLFLSVLSSKSSKSSRSIKKGDTFHHQKLFSVQPMFTPGVFWGKLAVPSLAHTHLGTVLFERGLALTHPQVDLYGYLWYDTLWLVVSTYHWLVIYC